MVVGHGRGYACRVGQLKVWAVNAQLDDGRVAWLLGTFFRVARWELTCGFCKERFRKTQYYVSSTAVCPHCGTRNLLPVPRFPRDPGPRPPNWPDYHPPAD